MRFKQLLNDDDAVSPVIGVILMVAITVILAAVIGTFVLGLGDQVQTTSPNAQFSFDYSSGNPATLDIVHDGGDGIEAGELYVSGDVDTGGSWDSAGYSTVRAGDSVDISDSGDFQWASSVASDTDGDGTTDTVSDDAEIRVVWQDSDSEQSSTLRTWTKN